MSFVLRGLEVRRGRAAQCRIVLVMIVLDKDIAQTMVREVKLQPRDIGTEMHHLGRLTVTGNVLTVVGDKGKMRTGLKILGRDEGRTAFDNLPFPARPFYTGTPWFLPAAVAWRKWRDWLDELTVRRG